MGKINELDLGGIARSDDDYLAKEQATPQNTSADGNGGSFEISGTEGAIEVVAEVGADALDLSDTKVLTIKLQDSADNSSFDDLATIYTITASSGSGAIAAETELARFVIPSDARRYIKAVITTDDADVGGKINIFQNYLAR